MLSAQNPINTFVKETLVTNKQNNFKLENNKLKNLFARISKINLLKIILLLFFSLISLQHNSINTVVF